MACLLVLFVAAAVLTVPLDAAPPAKLQLARAARTPAAAEAFWRAALPDAPMPEAIRELLHPASAAGAKVPKDNDDDHPPLPPLNFKYDDYRGSPRNQAAAPSPETLKHVAGYYSTAAWPAAVFFLEDAARPVGGSLPLRSIPEEEAAGSGGLVVVCRRDAAPDDDDGRDAVVYGCRAVVVRHAVLDAPARNVKSSSSA